MDACVCVLYTAIWDYPKDVMQPYVNARQMNFTNYSSHCTTPFKIKCQIHTCSSRLCASFEGEFCEMIVQWEKKSLK